MRMVGHGRRNGRGGGEGKGDGRDGRRRCGVGTCADVMVIRDGNGGAVARRQGKRMARVGTATSHQCVTQSFSCIT